MIVAIFLSALEASSVLTPSQLLAAHVALHVLIVKKLNSGYNWESAAISTLESKTFLSVEVSARPEPLAAELSPEGGTTPLTTVKRQREADLEREVGNLKRALADKNPEAGASSSVQKSDQLCWNFQAGKCNNGSRCSYTHKCAICETEGHAAKDCPQKKP